MPTSGLQYAVIDADGDLASVVPSLESAIGVAERLPGGRTLVEEVPEDAFQLNPQDAPTALKGSTLPQLTADAVMALSLEEAHARLAPILTTYHVFNKKGEDKGRVKGNDTVAGMADNFLSQNYKTSKDNPNAEYPTLVQGLNLVPHRLITGKVPGFENRTLASWRLSANFCVGSNQACRESCLAFSGQNAMTQAQAAKAYKTKALLTDPVAFCRMLVEAVRKHQVRCQKGITETYTTPDGKIKKVPGGKKIVHAPFVRLNVLSDIPWELVFPGIFEMFPDVQFYDYTKVVGRKPPKNYDLTFSLSGSNDKQAMSEIRDGRRVAVVMVLIKGNKAMTTVGQAAKKAYKVPLPPTYWDLPVVDGDVSDLRPLDPHPCVVGLRWKVPKTGRGYTYEDFAEMKFVIPCSVTESGTVIAAVTPRQQPIEDAPEGDVEEAA